MPRMVHAVRMPKGVSSVLAADLLVCSSSADPELWGAVLGIVDYLLVWWEWGLHGPPEVSGACGIHCSLYSWGFLPFLRFSASLFDLPCPVFALSTYFHKLSPTEKRFVIIGGSRKQFPCLWENRAIRKAPLSVGVVLGCPATQCFALQVLGFRVWCLRVCSFHTGSVTHRVFWICWKLPERDLSQINLLVCKCLQF